MITLRIAVTGTIAAIAAIALLMGPLLAAQRGNAIGRVVEIRSYNLKPGTRVVSNSFDMGDWKADKTIDTVGKCETYCNAFFWLVPAKVDGAWQMSEAKLVLKQKFQFFTGTLTKGKVVTPVKGRLTGPDIALTAGSTQFTGKVSGSVMEGTAKTGDKEEPWKAMRGKG